MFIDHVEANAHPLNLHGHTLTNKLIYIRTFDQYVKRKPYLRSWVFRKILSRMETDVILNILYLSINSLSRILRDLSLLLSLDLQRVQNLDRQL